jgi:MFS family permease
VPNAASPQQDALQRRTLIVLTLAQLLGGAGLAAGVTVGALIAHDLLGHTSLSGLPQALGVAGTALLALPLARYMARHGRRAGLGLGYLLGAIGAACIVSAGLALSLPLLLVGMLLFGGASAASDAARFAAADLARPHARGSAIGAIVFATAITAVAGPSLAAPSGWLARAIGAPELIGPFLLSIAGFTAATIVLNLFLRPDPLALARQARRSTVAPRLPVALLLRRPGVPLGLAAVTLANCEMILIMTMAPIHIAAHRRDLTAIGLVLSGHIAGMYAPAPLAGWLSDRWGRLPVIALGGVGLCGAGVLAIVSQPHDTPLLLLTLALLGAGWNLAIVGGSALVTDAVPVQDRPHVQGIADASMGVAGVIGAIASGLLLSLGGFAALGWAGAILAALLCAAVAWRRFAAG